MMNCLVDVAKRFFNRLYHAALHYLRATIDVIENMRVIIRFIIVVTTTKYVHLVHILLKSCVSVDM